MIRITLYQFKNYSKQIKLGLATPDSRTQQNQNPRISKNKIKKRSVFQVTKKPAAEALLRC